jgi:hypothetical protein
MSVIVTPIYAFAVLEKMSVGSLNWIVVDVEDDVALPLNDDAAISET